MLQGFLAVDSKKYDSELLKRKGWFQRIKRKLDFGKIDLAEDIDKVVFFNITPKAARKYDFTKFPREKLVLLSRLRHGVRTVAVVRRLDRDCDLSLPGRN